MKESCRETLEQVYLFLDVEQLSDDRRREIQTHLEECRPCFERYGVEREVQAVIARLRGKAVCPDELRARIAQLIDES